MGGLGALPHAPAHQGEAAGCTGGQSVVRVCRLRAPSERSPRTGAADEVELRCIVFLLRVWVAVELSQHECGQL